MKPGVAPTRRGYAVATVAGLAAALFLLSGIRSLHAVIVPSVVALVVAAGQLWLADPPTIERTTPEPGFPTEERTVRVDVNSAVPCTVDDRTDEGLGGPSWFTATDHPRPVETGHHGRFEYPIRLKRRGLHRIGPARCRQTDSLGLFVRTSRPAETTSVLVYPDVYEIHAGLVAGLVERHLGRDRGSFDRLREYAIGDRMRDIHWKASAKRPEGEFVVAEHEHHIEDDRIRIVAESDARSADAMASATASLATHLREAGVGVAVALPDAEVTDEPGASDRLLRALALTDGGAVPVDRRAGADVRVRGDGGRATIAIADREVDFESAVEGTPGRATA